MIDIDFQFNLMYIIVFIVCSLCWSIYCLYDYDKCKRKDIKSDIRIKSYAITILIGIFVILIIELVIIFIPFPNNTMDCIRFVNITE